ncbi:MAG: DUF1844 domain-containing protein [Candidatus Cloacimonetes bacterium]|nr:DUF1844 domain-containing protein [Candidatus Cloacimonadota bacterium]MBS3766793.1 DUF1844 domain-containing protein [Candidatus Cloacimonadota bacterium]
MEEKQTPFGQLLMSLHVQGMIALGKIKNPMTDKIDKNLNVAKSSIKILEDLKEKTEGNLSEREENIIKNIISELRKNYVQVANEEEDND